MRQVESLIFLPGGVSYILLQQQLHERKGEHKKGIPRHQNPKEGLQREHSMGHWEKLKFLFFPLPDELLLEQYPSCFSLAII